VELEVGDELYLEELGRQEQPLVDLHPLFRKLGTGPQHAQKTMDPIHTQSMLERLDQSNHTRALRRLRGSAQIQLLLIEGIPTVAITSEHLQSRMSCAHVTLSRTHCSKA
jgi:hypothetical protein